MYNRKTLCLLAGMELEAFKSASKIDRRTGFDDLPFLGHDASADDIADSKQLSGYSRYKPLDVLALACAQQLSAGGGYVAKGISFANASKIVSNNLGSLAEAVRAKHENRGLVLIGYGQLAQGGFNVADTLANIALQIAGKYADEVQVLTVIAPATVCAAIEARAAENGIDWKSDRLWSAE